MNADKLYLQRCRLAAREGPLNTISEMATSSEVSKLKLIVKQYYKSQSCKKVNIFYSEPKKR